MGWLSSVAGFLKGEGVVKPVTDLLAKKAEIKGKAEERKLELEQAIHERRVKLIEQGLHADAAWEIEQIKNSGVKDEWVLFLLSIPLVLVFIPATAPYVMQGFNILESTPGWYRFLVVTIFGAIYGIRLYRRQQTDT